jgi:Hypoxia induced protein conserved region
MIGYGVYDFKNRGSMSASVYVMQYRVKAQSVIVGAITVGVTYAVVKDYLKKRQTSSPDPK